MIRQLFICGAGNPEGVRLAIRVNERARHWERIVLLDDDSARLGARQLGLTVVGPFERLADADPGDSEVVNLIARTTRRRRDARARIAAYGIPWATLISRDVDLLGATVGTDLIAYQHATIGPDAHVGEGSVVFMSATVGHECHVGDHCVVATNAVLNARVRLGDGVYVGSNAVVLPEIEIGADATIGAGAVVIDHVPAGATVIGGLSDIVHAAAAERSGAPDDLAGILHSLWSEVLGLEQVPASRNFFDLGGSSLQALRLAQRIEAATGLPVCAVDLFHFPTLAALDAHLRGNPGSPVRSALDAAQQRAEMRRGLHRPGARRASADRP